MATLLQLCQPFDHAVMAAIQQLSGAMMDKIMLVFTFLGEETFAILLLIAVYWCWDKRIGEYLLFSLYTAMSLNGLLKDIICRPRPFLNDEFSDLRYVKVKGLLVDTEHLSSSWSFPSGHSQTAGSIYGSLINGRKLGIKVCGIAVILLVMLSRVYLGVHYPTDTIVGAVLGLLCAWVCGLLFRRFYQHRLLLMAAAVLLSGLMLLVSPSGDSVKPWRWAWALYWACGWRTAWWSSAPPMASSAGRCGSFWALHLSWPSASALRLCCPI